MHHVFVRGSAPLEDWHLVPGWPAYCHHAILSEHLIGGHLHRNTHNINVPQSVALEANIHTKNIQAVWIRVQTEI